jgi:hypothetical protein
MLKRTGVILGVIAVAGVILWQARTTGQNQAVPADHGSAGQAAPTGERDVRPSTAPAQLRPQEKPTRAAAASDTAQLQERVAALEKQVMQLTQASEYLMARGQLPLAEHKLAELAAKVGDVNASDRDRLQALRLLRRNGAISDSVIESALAWLQTATNGGLREDLVEQLGGTTNQLLRGSMLKLAANDPNADVREEAVRALRRFAADPQVEATLWDLLRKDTDGGVREEAEEALREGPMTETRRTAMQTRALDPNSTLDERLLAVRALRNGGDVAPEITAVLAQFAQSSQDPDERRACSMLSMDPVTRT